jgi:glycosyltransferase involved in cell wall biosynthesis
VSDPASIAVVIPVFNKRPHLERSLSSVRRQTRPPQEVIVVEDGSTDGSREFLEGPARDILDFRLLHRTEPGPGGYAARNLAIREARSEWIAFLDADDSWREDHLEGLAGLMALSKPATALVFSSYEFSGRRDDRHPPRVGPGPVRLDERAFLGGWARGRLPLLTSAFAARRERLLEVGLFPEGLCKRGGDKDLWFRLMRGAEAVGSDRPSATYHVDSVNMVTRTVSYRDGSFVAARMLASSATHPDPDLLARIWALETSKYALVSLRGGDPRPFLRALREARGFSRHGRLAASQLIRQGLHQATSLVAARLGR